MNKLAILLLVCLFSLSGMLFAQQDPIYSQYMMNQLIINPGYAGINDVVCLNATTRQQWVGIKGAPNTTIFDGNAPIKPFGINSGVGVVIFSDNLGFQKNLALNLDYCYKMDLRKGKLGLGINLGFFNQALKADKWIPPQYSDPRQDDLIPGTNESAFGFDAGLGAYYKTDDLYLGLSSDHILQPKVKFQNAYTQLKRHYYLLAGYRIVMPNPLIEVRPSTFLASDGKTTSLTLNTNVVYNKRFMGGVSYRAGDAIIAMLGIELFNGLKVSYSYDITTTGLSHYSSGTHEFVLGYCFNLKVEKTSQKYKSVRFL
jgi:type IX secretion system PorP/SprF family membrane protein